MRSPVASPSHHVTHTAPYLAQSTKPASVNVAKTIAAEKRRRNMACDCAGQSYSYDSTVRGQPVYPTGLSHPLSPSRSCRARHFWFSCPLILPSYLILPSFPLRLHFSWCLSPKDESAVVAS